MLIIVSVLAQTGCASPKQAKGSDRYTLLDSQPR